MRREKEGKMKREEAEERAMNYICFMNLGQIESECQERGIKISKNRAVMERKLIAALTVEFMHQHYRKV